MDESALTRRRLLELAGTGLARAALAACEAGPRRLPHPCADRHPSKSTSGSVGRSKFRTRSGSFVSAFRPGIATHWSVAAPDCRPAARARLPRGAVPPWPGRQPPGPASTTCGPGASCSATSPRAGRRSPSRRWTAGDTWWHARADGSDTQSMLVKEFVPFLGDQGYDLGRIGLFGLSMGGFGVAAAGLPGPATRRSGRGGHESGGLGPVRRREGSAFDSAGRLRGHTTSSRSGPGSQRRPNGSTAAPRTTCRHGPGLPCRTCRAPVEGGFRPGGHDAPTGGPSCRTWLSFLGRHLG